QDEVDRFLGYQSKGGSRDDVAKEVLPADDLENGDRSSGRERCLVLSGIGAAQGSRHGDLTSRVAGRGAVVGRLVTATLSHFIVTVGGGRRSRTVNRQFENGLGDSGG